MTLNLMLTSRSAVFLSGDFRLTWYAGKTVIKREDRLATQKIVPVIKRYWSALVGWTGVAKTPTEDVGEWLARTVNDIDRNAPFKELPQRLLGADNWLVKCPHRDLAFSVVGFFGRKPVALVVSNCYGLGGQVFWPRLSNLKDFWSKPKGPEVVGMGDTTGLTEAMKGRLKDMLIANRSPEEIHAAMAAVNAEAAQHSKDQTISTACVTGALLPTGAGTVVPHGIPASEEYFPGFVRRSFLAKNITGFVRKLGNDGKPLPVGWVQMSWRTVGKGRNAIQGVVEAHELRGIKGAGSEVPVGHDGLFWKL